MSRAVVIDTGTGAIERVLVGDPTMMALQVIREITGFGEGLVGRLLLIDAFAMRFETMEYGWDPANPLNGTAG